MAFFNSSDSNPFFKGSSPSEIQHLLLKLFFSQIKNIVTKNDLFTRQPVIFSKYYLLRKSHSTKDEPYASIETVTAFHCNKNKKPAPT